MSLPLVDVNSLIGIQSAVAESGPQDPWGPKLLAEFVDLYVYSDAFRYSVPVVSGSRMDPSELPILVGELERTNPGTALPQECDVGPFAPIREEYLNECLAGFGKWLGRNPRMVMQWVFAHTRWIPELDLMYMERECVFDVGLILSSPRFQGLLDLLRCPPEPLLYTLDSVLRYPVYGAASKGEYYLNHPVRDGFPLPTAEYRSARPPIVPVRWGPTVAKGIMHRGVATMVQTLDALRTQVRACGLQSVDPSTIETDLIRQIAADARLPARLSGFTDLAAIAAGVIATMGASSTLGPYSAVLGGVVGISTALWKGHVPGSVASRLQWLKWVRWEVEDQLRDA